MHRFGWRFSGTGARSYELSGTEREYLRSGRTATYTEPTLESRIQAKVNLLPERLDALFLDLSLLSAKGHLSDSGTGSVWANLLQTRHQIDIGLERRLRQQRIDQGESSTHEAKELDDAFGLGYEFGGLVHLLQQTTEQESAWEDIIWGILCEYLLSASSSANLEERYETLFELIGSRTELGAGSKGAAPYGESDECIVRFTRDGDHVLSESVYTVRKISDTAVSLGSDIHVDVKWRSWGGAKNDRRAGIDSEPSHDKKVAALSVKLRKDAKASLEKTYLGMDVETVVSTICESKRPLSSAEIAEEIERGVATNLVTSITNKLSNPDGEERWTSDQIVEGSKNGWMLTSYGELLLEYHLFAENRDNWVDNRVSGPLPPLPTVDSPREISSESREPDMTVWIRQPSDKARLSGSRGPPRPENFEDN